MDDRRLDVLASIGARLAVGAYPLVFILVFGWSYGKDAFDLAAAAMNWAAYLNVFLLSGFVLAPPAVARLRVGQGDRERDGSALRDHMALMHLLLVAGASAAIALWGLIGAMFPTLDERGGNRLTEWFPLFAVLALSQLPLTLWSGIAQAAGEYRAILLWTLGPRLLAILALLGMKFAAAAPTPAILVTALIVVYGQFRIARLGAGVLRGLDAGVATKRGRAGNVLRPNLSAGLISLVGTLVTIAPVTLVGRWLADDVGAAHVMVTLSNAFGAVVVAAFFPSSLALASNVALPGAMRRHSRMIAGRVGGATIMALGIAWIIFPICSALSSSCNAPLYQAGSFVLVGAGLRLASLGVLHSAISRGHPHLSLLSAVAEAGVVALMAWLLIHPLGLLGIGYAFCAGGAARLLTAFGAELPLIERAFEPPGWN